MSSRIHTSCRSTPRLTAAASGLEPMTPSCTSPEAIAVATLAPESNWRHRILYPVAFSIEPFAMAATIGPAICW